MEPTFRQLETLATMYNVPEWVFLREKLPSQYDYRRKLPLFRQYSSRNGAFSKYRTRMIVSRVEQLRNVIIEFCRDFDKEIQAFDPPGISGRNVAQAAFRIKKWLRMDDGSHRDFNSLRRAVEGRNIFVFVTSKFSDWSMVGNDEFRGFAIYHRTMPIIVINGSDALAAQSFTLMHELGHLVFRKKSVFSEKTQPDRDEKLCDRLAGEILMPSEEFMRLDRDFRMDDAPDKIVRNLDKYARFFKTSKQACAVRMHQLGMISLEKHNQVNQILQQLLEGNRRLLREQENRRIRRNIAGEKFNQYGSLYCQAVAQAYQDKQVTLFRSCQQFGFKRVQDFFDLEAML